MCRDAADTKFAALFLYFPKLYGKNTVILRAADCSVEVLTQDLLNTKQEW